MYHATHETEGLLSVDIEGESPRLAVTAREAADRVSPQPVQCETPVRDIESPLLPLPLLDPLEEQEAQEYYAVDGAWNNHTSSPTDNGKQWFDYVLGRVSQTRHALGHLKGGGLDATDTKAHAEDDLNAVPCRECDEPLQRTDFYLNVMGIQVRWHERGLSLPTAVIDSTHPYVDILVHTYAGLDDRAWLLGVMNESYVERQRSVRGGYEMQTVSEHNAIHPALYLVNATVLDDVVDMVWTRYVVEQSQTTPESEEEPEKSL
jgi:hypothetical protein